MLIGDDAFFGPMEAPLPFNVELMEAGRHVSEDGE